MAKKREEFAKIHPSFALTGHQWRNLSGKEAKLYITLWVMAFYRRKEIIDLDNEIDLLMLIIGVKKATLYHMLERLSSIGLTVMHDKKYLKVIKVKKLHYPVRFNAQKELHQLIDACVPIGSIEEEEEEEEDKEEEVLKKAPAKKRRRAPALVGEELMLDLLNSDTPNKKIVGLHMQRWQERYGSHYAPTKTDYIVAAAIVKLDEFPEVDRRHEAYLNDNDKFYKDAHHPFTMFKTAWNKFAEKKGEESGGWNTKKVHEV